MIVGIGIDIIELQRINDIILKKPSFITRILTSIEKKVFDSMSIKRQAEFLGGRFAAKEAFSKAYGTGIGKVSFHDLSILNEANGRPYIIQELFDGNVFLSISHTESMATAYVMLETVENQKT